METGVGGGDLSRLVHGGLERHFSAAVLLRREVLGDDVQGGYPHGDGILRGPVHGLDGVLLQGGSGLEWIARRKVRKGQLSFG
jgi:hypothetical protein